MWRGAQRGPEGSKQTLDCRHCEVLSDEVTSVASAGQRHVFPAQGVGQKGVEGSKQALVETIQGLQRALERSRKECEAGVSSAKYMQVPLPCYTLPSILPSCYCTGLTCCFDPIMW